VQGGVGRYNNFIVYRFPPCAFAKASATHSRGNDKKVGEDKLQRESSKTELQKQIEFPP